MNEYRLSYNNIINEYPINNQLQQSSHYRNLKYLLHKELLSANYPYYNQIYEEAVEDIKITLNDHQPELKMLGLRLARALPFLYRIKLIELCENVQL